METLERHKIFKQILWDYTIPIDDIEAVLQGEKERAGHYTREKLFLKMIETYSWFTILQFFTPNQIQILLTDQMITQLRSPSLRKKYEFVQKRLQQIIPVAG